MARENTLEAFQKAIDLHADMIEFDVRRTRDRRYVIHHDPHIAGKPLNEIALREVRDMARTLGFHVPDLEEVLALARGRTGFDIELKEEGYESDILDLITGILPEECFMVSSFHASSIERVKRHRRGVKTGFIFADPAALTAGILAGDADWLLPFHHLAAGDLLENMQQAGKKIAVWTVNDKERMKRLFDDNRIDGIITDRPDIALAVRAGCEDPD